MTEIKSYTDIDQSKKLAEILSPESADMCFVNDGTAIKIDANSYNVRKHMWKDEGVQLIPCWSLAALLNILHNKAKDIPSLSGGGYRDGEYISDWCLDYEFENGDYQKTFADNPVDACVDMILKLHGKGLL
jgi:hypothetical protein